MIKHIVIILMIIFSLSACSENFFHLVSKPTLLDTTPPPGPIEYQAGFVDGCNTAIGENRRNVFALATKRFYKHPEMNSRSNLYRRMWRSAYIYCALYIPYLDKQKLSMVFGSDFKLQNKAIRGTWRHQLLHDAPDGPPNFRIGWKQGCATGKAATGKAKHKIAYKFIKDSRYIEGDAFNAEYEKGWETAFWYCQRYYDIMESPDRKSFL